MCSENNNAKKEVIKFGNIYNFQAKINCEILKATREE